MAGTRRLRELVAAISGNVDLPAGGLVVALSGGADSAACAYLAAATGRARAIHVHHGLPDSDSMEAAAVAVAARLRLGLTVERITIDRWSEASARNERYRVLLAALETEEWLLTGHTADDQAETVLANLLRGTGLDGLAGIHPRRPPIARPLLLIDRAQTRELATLASLPWRDDPANLDKGPLRNRIRRELIPRLEAEFNPALRRHLQDLASNASQSSPGALVPAESDQGRSRLPLGMLHAVGEERALWSLREALRPLRAGYAPTRAEILRLLEVVEGRAAATQLGGGLRVERLGPWLQIATPEDRPVAARKWRVPGSTSWGGFRWEAVVSSSPPTAMPLSLWQAVLDLDRIGDSLVIDTRPGGGPRLRAGNKIVWDPGVRVYSSGWVDGATGRYLSALCEEEPWLR
ncbi:MAG TPA: tRNA lysidine(34) synthetase TilS [Acidimicrobiia bacterium]|nr:tRNA lysidine(34) synthetase TilS [Acidimicrobiia bacterium]